MCYLYMKRVCVCGRVYSLYIQSGVHACSPLLVIALDVYTRG